MNLHVVQRLAFISICGVFAFTVGCSHHSSSSSTPPPAAPAKSEKPGSDKDKSTAANIEGSTKNTTATGQTEAENESKEQIAASAVAGAVSTASRVGPNSVTNNQIASGFEVAPASATETIGGRMLLKYLNGTMSGPAVVDATFTSQSLVVQRLTEMSFVVNKLRATNQYTNADHDKVQLLEAALNRRLNETIQYRDNLDTYLKVGTAALVGGVAGYFAPQITRGVGAVVRPTARGISAASKGLYSGIRGVFVKEPAAAASAEAAAAGSGASKVAPAAGAADPAAAAGSADPAAAAADADVSRVASAAEAVAEAETGGEAAGTVAGKADELRVASEAAAGGEHTPPLSEQPVVHVDKGGTATVAKTEEAAAGTATGELSAAAGQTAAAAEKTTEAAEKVVARDIARALDSADLEKGFVIARISAEEASSASGPQTLKYSESGMKGFAVHKGEGESFLTARVKTETGHEYFRVEGQAIETQTLEGKTLTTSADDVIKIASARMKNWATEAEAFAQNPGAARPSIKTKVMESRPYQAATSEAGRSALSRTAVGGTTGLLTLWGLSTVDTKYFTVDDYVKALAKQGIDLNEMPNQLRTNIATRAKIPATVPEQAQ